MVLSFKDEYKPKCYLCQIAFESIDNLKSHIQKIHKKHYFNNLQKSVQTPGDLTIF